MEALNLSTMMKLGDPVYAYSFDVLVEGVSISEVTTIKVKPKQLELTCVVTDKSRVQDLSFLKLAVRVYQKIGDKSKGEADKWFEAGYRLKKLKTVLIEGSSGSLETELMYVTQVYEYDSPSIQSSK